jgi:hypothetical protein
MIPEIRTDPWKNAESRPAKWARLMAEGAALSAELQAVAAASQRRLAAIDRDFPDTV